MKPLYNYSIKDLILRLFMLFFTLLTSLFAFLDNKYWLLITVVPVLVLFLSLFLKERNRYNLIVTILVTLSIPFFIFSKTVELSYKIIIVLMVYTMLNFILDKALKYILSAIIIILFGFKINSEPITFTLLVIMAFISLLINAINRYREDEIKHNLKREEKLKKLTITDHLTGLYNRNYMEKKLKSIHSIWKRGIQSYSLIMVDIDYFKNYNDSYGHIQGDECLQIISSILKKQLNRETDYAFRYGGEEFLIILGFTDRNGADIVAKRIQKAIIEAHIPHKDSKVSDIITLSIGVATIDDNNDSLNNLLERTDRALYRAKESGRNKIIHAEEGVVLPV